MELIKDEQANSLLYPKRVNGHILFGGLVHNLNRLKQQIKQVDKSNSLVKEIMANLYGVCCERNKIRKSLDKPVYLNDPVNVIDISEKCVTYNKIGKRFKFSYARLGTFLTAKARLLMVQAIYPIREHVFRFHTDSILSDIPLEHHLKVSENLGDFKASKENGLKCQMFKSGKKVEWL
jgi:hypothetical protein